jgi:hypothetical protein
MAVNNTNRWFENANQEKKKRNEEKKIHCLKCWTVGNLSCTETATNTETWMRSVNDLGFEEREMLR